MGLRCSSEMQEPFLYCSSGKEVKITMNSPLVGLQHTPDIRVELGIQEGAREESLVKLRLLLAMQPVVGSMEAKEKGFLVSHSLLYSSSVVTKLLDNPPALSPRVLAKEGIQDQVVAVLDKLGGQGGSRISIKQGDNWEWMGRNSCTEGIHSVTMNSSLVGSLDLVQVSLQHTSDIKVELGSQEMAREHIGIGSTEIKKSKLGGQGGFFSLAGSTLS